MTVGFAAPIAAAAMAFGKFYADMLPGASPLAVSLGIAVLVTIVHLRGTEVGAASDN